MNVVFYGLWVWHGKVGYLTAMIPVGVIFITFKQPQRAFLSTVFYCKLTAVLPLGTVVTFASESQQRPPNARSVNNNIINIITFYCFCSELL